MALRLAAGADSSGSEILEEDATVLGRDCRDLADGTVVVEGGALLAALCT